MEVKKIIMKNKIFFTFKRLKCPVGNCILWYIDFMKTNKKENLNSIRKSIQPDKAEKIASSFPDLNIAWLMTGEGDMIKGTITQNANGDNNTQIAGNGNHINNAATLDKAIDEISAMRKLLETAIQNNKEQADKFFSIIERITTK